MSFVKVKMMMEEEGYVGDLCLSMVVMCCDSEMISYMVFLFAVTLLSM